MKSLMLMLSLILLPDLSCYARCNCDDWMSRGGYCVDYVKRMIPAFPVPQSHAEIMELKNLGIQEVSEGDVAIFDLGRYWHVAYVERVHRDQWGNPKTIDVSEMNYGGDMSFDEFRSRWRPPKKAEWRRAVCCGVTDGYEQISFRRNVPLTTVTQIWSPTAASEASAADKARDVLSRLFRFVERELL